MPVSMTGCLPAIFGNTVAFVAIAGLSGLTCATTTPVTVAFTGSAATAVRSPYTVTFNRSLQNCAVSAVAGFGDPGGGLASANLNAVPEIQMDPSGDHSQVRVIFVNGGTMSDVDTSFLITAFC